MQRRCGAVGENRIPMTLQPHHGCPGSVCVFISQCFKERRDQRDLNKVGGATNTNLLAGKRRCAATEDMVQWQLKLYASLHS
jgi:hypothetical protein